MTARVERELKWKKHTRKLYPFKPKNLQGREKEREITKKREKAKKHDDDVARTHTILSTLSTLTAKFLYRSQGGGGGVSRKEGGGCVSLTSLLA